MYIATHHLWLFLQFLQLTVQHKSAEFGLLRGLEIRPESRWSPYLYGKGVTLISICGNLCLSDLRCSAAIFDKSLEQCQLSTCPLDLYFLNRGTELVYMDMGEVHSNNSVSSRDGNHLTYQDCQQAFDSGERCSGIFTLKNPSTVDGEFDAFCEFDNEHGWTVIQRRLDGSVDFYRDWDDYVNGFGEVAGEYWIGLENIQHLTTTNREMSIYLEDHEGESREANYSTFYLSDSSTNYRIIITGYSGNAGNSLLFSSTPFSTKDEDNDILGPESCATKHQGAWWYVACFESNLNGAWHPANSSGGDNMDSAAGIIWSTWKGYHYSLKAVTMMITRG